MRKQATLLSQEDALDRGKHTASPSFGSNDLEGKNGRRISLPSGEHSAKHTPA